MASVEAEWVMIELEMDLQIKFVPFVGFLFEMERVD